MTDNRTATPDTYAAMDDLTDRIGSGVVRARAVLFWEDLWPRLVWPLGFALTFVAVSWIGLWVLLPDMARIAGLMLFAISFVASFWVFRGLRLPTREDGLARLEQATGLENRPLQTLGDRLPETADPVTQALWTAHRARLAASIGPLQTGFPAPQLDRRDIYGLRVIVALLLFVGYFAAGDAKLDPILKAFRPFSKGATIEARLDAWVTPPDYTGKPAILLTAGGGAASDQDGTIHVPAGSSLMIRASGMTTSVPLQVTTTDLGSNQTTPLVPRQADHETSSAQGNKQASPIEFEMRLATSSAVEITHGGTPLAHWRFSVIPDKPPTIKFVGEPEAQASGTLKITYEIADDYGVVGAEAHFEPSPGSFAITTNAASVRPIVAAPDYPLSLPSGHAKSGQVTSFHDLTSHPWAGGKVRLTLVARNEAGIEGQSETKEVMLPARGFSKPLARAIVEQRRFLALDANRQPQVDDAFDALLIAPEHFYESSAIYLGVSKIYRDLLAAKSDDHLRDIVAFMWEVAIGIEDGNLSQAEKDVRDAEEALRKALDQGASDQDIARLTQELRKALDTYMHELAEAARRNPALLRQPSANQKILQQRDINRMLDRIETLSKTGSRDAAREMLSELQRMMENLQNADGQQDGDQQQSEENQALDKLGDMIQRQQKLMDKTHRLGRKGHDTDQQNGREKGDDTPLTPDQLQQALKDLENNQSDLRQALKSLQDQLSQQGLGQKPQKKPGDGDAGKQGQAKPGGDQSSDEDNPLDRASGAMGDAKDALADGSTDDAVDAQGRALDHLRDDAKKLMEQMAQNQGKGRSGMTQGGQATGEDPLGRSRRANGPQDGSSVKVPNEIDTQRAREVLDAIRQRLSESMRPRLELDYLERLLQGE